MSDTSLIGHYIKGRYLLQEVIGTGGMGVVFKAYDHELQRKCAVKLLKSTVTKETTYQRFEEEIRLITKLNSPHIVQVYDAGVSEYKKRFVVMELLHGLPLSAILANETTLDAERGLHIALGICLALETAHQAGVIHRDLKPANIFVDPSPEGDLIKILDFGIAKDLNRDISLDLTSTGMLVGTPTYMAPESFSDQPHITAKVDLYAVGLLLHRMITGRIPFYPDHPDLPKAIRGMPIPIQICWLHLNSVPPLIDHIPIEIAEFITLLLEKDPYKRPQTAKAIIQKIHYLLHTYYPKNHENQAEEFSNTQILPKSLFAEVTHSLDVDFMVQEPEVTDNDLILEKHSSYPASESLNVDHDKNMTPIHDLPSRTPMNIMGISDKDEGKFVIPNMAHIDTETVALNPAKIKALHEELEAYMESQGMNVIAHKDTQALKRNKNHDDVPTDLFMNPKVKRSRPYIRKLLLLLCILGMVCYYILTKT